MIKRLDYFKRERGRRLLKLVLCKSGLKVSIIPNQLKLSWTKYKEEIL